jgi:hypothetical protein
MVVLPSAIDDPLARRRSRAAAAWAMKEQGDGDDEPQDESSMRRHLRSLAGGLDRPGDVDWLSGVNGRNRPNTEGEHR